MNKNDTAKKAGRRLQSRPSHPAFTSAGIVDLLSQAGLPPEHHLTRLPGGGNNRVYRLDCRKAALLLKAYFHHPDDPRDRLAAEFSFSRFAWDRGVSAIPRPVARDDRNHLGLYEFVHGRMPAAEEIGAGEVDQAAEFFTALNRHKSDPAAAALADGSEACFTLAEHLACVQRRFDRLESSFPAHPVCGTQRHAERVEYHAEAANWIHESLLPAWRRIREQAVRQSAAYGIDVDEPIPAADRCLSPSDFGFHNAILAGDGRLRFVDFEYAGWDDPAKTVCDFLCQPKRPVPGGLAARFTAAVLAALSDLEFHRRRVDVLLPVYRLKWCAIMMNDFLPVGSRRRNFAQPDGGADERKRVQLAQADRALQSVGV